MPAGTILEHVNGVIYAVSGANIFYSEPLRFGLCDFSKNFYSFPQDISVMLGISAAGQHGLYVCSDNTYWLEAPGTEDVRQKPVLPFGGVKGTGIHLPNTVDVTWFSPRGQVQASLGGQAKITSEGVFIPGIMSGGSAILREKEGLRQIINVVQRTENNVLSYTGG
jgi:hypothetical protein